MGAESLPGSGKQQPIRGWAGKSHRLSFADRPVTDDVTTTVHDHSHYDVDQSRNNVVLIEQPTEWYWETFAQPSGHVTDGR